MREIMFIIGLFTWFFTKVEVNVENILDIFFLFYIFLYYTFIGFMIGFPVYLSYLERKERNKLFKG